MSELVRIESAIASDLISNSDNEAYAVKLFAGRYVIADPELIFDSEIFEKWNEVAEIENPNNIGPGGLLFAARINGRPVGGLTTYVGSGEFTDDDDNEVSTRSGILAAIPTTLLDELEITYTNDLIIAVSEDDMIVYSDDSHMIFFGKNPAIFTGYPEDDERNMNDEDDEDY